MFNSTETSVTVDAGNSLVVPVILASSERPVRVSKLTKVLVKSYDPESGRKCFNQYRILSEIGRGSFGKVKLCEDEVGRLFAVKICRRPSPKIHFGSASKAFTAGFKNEVEIWRALDHQNIVKLYEVIDSAESIKVYLVMEYLPGGPIQYADKDVNPLLTLEETQRYFRDLITGLHYLHGAGILHRDIKPENLLLSREGKVKICDFGSAQRISDQQQHRRTLGSPAFLAPELYQDDTCEVTAAIDVWAAGLCLYMFVFGSMPFYALSIAELHRQIVNNHITFPWETDKQLEKLILGCLTKNAAQRLSAEAILKHPWMLSTPKLPLSLTVGQGWSLRFVYSALYRWPGQFSVMVMMYTKRLFCWLLWGWR